MYLCIRIICSTVDYNLDMKRLVIKNFGPVKEAVLDLDRIAVIIGMQSSGKSSILKMACFCSWVEKRIQLAQSDKMFQEPDAFRNLFTSYYGLDGYFKADTIVKYKSSYLFFSYNNQVFSFGRTPNIWRFRRPKIQYIPSERNIASFIPKWKRIPVRDGLLDFLSEWDTARQIIPVENNILQLGITYSYDIASDTDSIITTDGGPLPLSDSSSGLQSLIPLYVLVDYLQQGHSKLTTNKEKLSLEQRKERESLIYSIYEKLSPSVLKINIRTNEVESPSSEVVIDGKTYRFFSERKAVLFKKRYERFLYADHFELFLEEPEQNLYPPTQCQLVGWLVDMVFDSDNKNTLLVSTHSPYILNEMCKLYREGMNLYFTHKDETDPALYSLRKLTDKEVNEAYTSGTDLFFNSEAFV